MPVLDDDDKRPLPRPPYKSPLVTEDGVVSDAWLSFINELFVRVGNISAFSNKQLEELIDDLETRLSAIE